MLTRLKISGFKNLVDIDIHFGPFTVIAGPNGVGKSNLFDAIQFLSALADKPLLEAATAVRGEMSSSRADSIFTHFEGGLLHSLKFEVEMLVPEEVHDDLDQKARPTCRHLRYNLEISQSREPHSQIPRLELENEGLFYITKSSTGETLPWVPKKKAMSEALLSGKPRTSPFISTKAESGQPVFRIHEDSGHQGRSLARGSSSTVPRTMLSTINTIEYPTALAARREMQSWRLLQLEPARLRDSSRWTDTPSLDRDGSRLAAVLNRLLSAESSDRASVAAGLSNRLYELIGEIRTIAIDSDKARELYTLVIRTAEGVQFRSRELSDGTLRFLALAILEADPSWGGVLAMEEPENGIHPIRIPAIIRLLSDMAVDPSYAPGPENPLRQVIVNTHSPEVVGLAPENALLLAKPVLTEKDERTISAVEYRSLSGTWRKTSPNISRDEMMEYLQPLPRGMDEMDSECETRPVASRSELQSCIRQLPLFEVAENSYK